MRRARCSKRVLGFSLAELLAVVGILGIVTAAITAVLICAQRTWVSGSGQAVATAELRRALARVSREMTESRIGEIQRPVADGQWDTVALFRIPQDQDGDGSVLDANGVVVEWSGWIAYGRGADNSLLRAVDGVTTDTLANHISAVSFRRQAATPDVIEVEMTASTLTESGRQFDHTVESRIKVRN